MNRTLTALLFYMTCAATAFGASQELRERILDEVDRRLEQERARIRERIDALLQEELGHLDFSRPAESAIVQQIQAARREIEAQIAQLQEQMRTLDRQAYAQQVRLVELRCMERDTALIEEMTADPRNWGARVQQIYRDSFEAITEGESYLEGAEGFARVYYLLNNSPEGAELATSASYNGACGYSLGGDVERGLDWLEISLARGIWDQTCGPDCPYCGGGPFLRHIEMDTDLDAIRSTERFRQMLARYRQQ